MSQSESGSMTPDEVTNKSFDTKRRGGLDPDAVSSHLSNVAAAVQSLIDERDALKAQLDSAPTDTESSASAAPIEELDEDELAERIGHDAARVLSEARAAAADRISEAEEEAASIRAAAEEVYADRSRSADEEAARIREAADAVHEEQRVAAEQAAAGIVAAAEAEADQVRSTGAVSRESADVEAERIVREAELTRRQILEDLARRRSAARRQIEQLRAGRERLLASHETVRRALDDITEELSISMSEARAAAETAGHTVSDTTIEELEAEIETARLTGLLDTGPLPVVKKTPEARPSTPPASESSGVSASGSPSVETDEVAAEDEAPKEAEAIEESAPEVADDPAPAAGEAANTKSDPDLADVVQLDSARNDVDTATHPAKGRDAAVRASPALPTANRPDAPAGKASKVTKLESVKPAEEAPADDSVGDLFANLRSTTAEDAPKKTAAKKTAAKKTAAKKTAAKKAAAKKPAKKVEVDSSEMARRLKRVLADEQSRVMSTLKGADEMPAVGALLGTNAEHVDSYWTAVVAHFGKVSKKSDANPPVKELVDSIRRRVGDAIEDAGDDRDAAVSSLRSVYREVKTQQVGDCAHAVCLATAGAAAN